MIIATQEIFDILQRALPQLTEEGIVEPDVEQLRHDLQRIAHAYIVAESERNRLGGYVERARTLLGECTYHDIKMMGMEKASKLYPDTGEMGARLRNAYVRGFKHACDRLRENLGGLGGGDGG